MSSSMTKSAKWNYIHPIFSIISLMVMPVISHSWTIRARQRFRFLKFSGNNSIVHILHCFYFMAIFLSVFLRRRMLDITAFFCGNVISEGSHYHGSAAISLKKIFKSNSLTFLAIPLIACFGIKSSVELRGHFRF